jgi:DNA-binding transcriptional LysR family regulator
LKEKLCTLKGEISGNLHFACTNSLAQFFLPLPYLHMKQKYPKVKIQFHRGSLQYIHESLRTEKVSCALVLDARGFECYERHRLFLGSFRLYKKKDVPETAGVIIDHSENGEVIELQKRYQEHYGKELKLQDALSGWCLVLTFTLFGHGIGYLPDFMVQKKDDLQQVSLDFAPIEYAICLIKLKGVPLTKAESVFLDILKAHTANF